MKRLVTLLIAAFLVGAVWLYSSSKEGEVLVRAPTAPAKKVAAADQTTLAPTSEVRQRTPPVQRNTPASSAEHIFATSHDFSSDYQFLLSSPDPNALYFAAELVGVCRAFYDAASGQFVNEAARDPSAKINSLSERPQWAAETLRARCYGWTNRLPSGAEARALRLRSAEANSPVGKARLIQSLVDSGKSQEAVAIASEVIRRGDGYAFPMIASALHEAGAPWRLGKSGESVPEKLIEPVLQLASCDFGRYCGEGSTEITYFCATTGYCPKTLPDWVLESPSLLPEEREEIKHYRDIVVDAIRTGRLDQLGIAANGVR